MLSENSRQLLLNNLNYINKENFPNLYNNKNNELWNLLDIKDGLKEANFKILQEISYKCSFNCPYCMNKGLDYNVKELPVQDYINFYQKIIDQGGVIKELRITGGEPTQPGVIERTNELVEFAINNPLILKLQINTNGYWPIPIKWKSDKTLIQFSLDGNKEKMIKNTGKKDIFEKLIKNFDFCKQNDINFQFRCIIDEYNDIKNLIPFTKKYNKKAIITFALPVGAAENKNYSKEFYINMINNSTKINKYFKENNINATFREISGYCDQLYLPNYFNCMITPDGFIGGCAYMATKKITTININSFNLNIYDLREYLKNQFQDCTCYFPNGFLNFWNSLSDSEKNLLDEYINDFHRAKGITSLKNFYNI